MSGLPKVLVVDDRQENLLTVRAVLESLDVEILESTSGEGALRLLLENDFAVILLDVEMPGTDGFATAQMIRSRPKTAHIPIIFLTAVDRGPATTEQGYALGAVDYIIKPFVPEVLRWKVSVFAALHTKAAQTEQLLREQAARMEWETAAKRAALLADFTSTLASSMNYATSIRRLSELVVPHFADWARVINRTEEPDTFRKLPHNGGPVLIGETEDSFFSDLGEPSHGQGSALVIPLRGQTDPVGALVMFRATPRYSAKDRLLAEDLADRAALAITNSQLYEEAQAANRAKDQFLAIVSHELRTPLNAIIGWIQILRKKEVAPEMRAKAFQTIEQNARLQDELIGDILDISRIVAGQLSVEFEDVDVEALIRRTIDSLKPTAESRKVRLEATVHEGVPNVAGDPKRLQQVLWNLIANAIKFTPENGTVEVEASMTRSHLRIEVRDDGAGIRPELLSRIFDPFIQGDSSLKRSYGGLGLGLAITRHLVELHGGTVRANSPGEGKGSVFTVMLPARSAESKAS